MLQYMVIARDPHDLPAISFQHPQQFPAVRLQGTLPARLFLAATTDAGVDARLRGHDVHPAILEKSATLRVAARISERRARRLARSLSASGTPATLTVTLSKKASTGARNSASARMAPAKFSTLMAATVSAFTFWIAA